MKIAKGSGLVFFFAIVFVSMGLSGCALLGDNIPLSSGMQGRLEGNFYTSPSGSFRVRLPKLTKAAKIADEVPSAGVLLLSISDDLCREFIVSERPGNLGVQSITDWVNENIVEDLKPLGFEIKATARQTRHGSVVSLRYRAPGAAPCSQTGAKADKTLQAKADAEVGWYVFYHAGKVYRLIYAVGVGPQMPTSWLIRREPVETILAQFAEGLEIRATN